MDIDEQKKGIEVTSWEVITKKKFKRITKEKKYKFTSKMIL